jgi:glycosyltransferase involved in cell wall biosynthesis
LKVAYDYQIFFSQSYGGVSRYFFCLAHGIIEAQHQVKIFAPLHRNSYISSLPSGVVDGQRVIKFPLKTTTLISAYNHLITKKKIARWKPDVVHETYYSRFGSAPKNCPIVITVHDMIHELFPENFSAHDNTISLKKKAIDRADHIICVSDNTKQDLMRLNGTPANKITVVHHGFDKFSDYGIQSFAITMNERPFILYVGGRGGYKNFSGFLKAFASSKRLLSDFDIVAFGGGAFSIAESDLIREMSFFTHQVRHVSGDDMLLARHYSTARAFVYPSLYEGFGIPPLEAMAHNCPVISSNTSSLPEVIGDAAQYFSPTNLEEMKLAIELVVYSDSRVNCLINLGKQRLAYFSWEKCVQETLDIYRSLT